MSSTPFKFSNWATACCPIREVKISRCINANWVLETGLANGYFKIFEKQLRMAQDDHLIDFTSRASKDAIECDFDLQNIDHPTGVNEYRVANALSANLVIGLPAV